MPGKKVFVALLAVLFIIVLVPAGCGQKQSAQKPQSSNPGQKPKAPAAAEDILKDITTIIAELDRKTKAQKVPALEQTSQSKSQDEGSSKGDENQGNGSSKGGQESQGGGSQGNMTGSQSQKGSQQPSQGGEQKGTASWQKETQSLKNLHRKWNMLEPQAAEVGMPPSFRNSFEQALDNLTLAISNQNLQESLTAAIELYGQCGELARVYQMPQPAEFYQVQYGVMAAMSAAGRGEWDTAKKEISTTKDPWSMLLPRLGKQNKMLGKRLDFSLRDLGDAIDTEEMNLVAIKGEIVMNNLKALEEKLSQNQSQSGS